MMKPFLTPRPTLPFEELRRHARLRLLKMHYASGVGHIGGNLSALDLLLCLYHRILQPDDCFILSKGHSAGALYVVLWTLGRLSEQDLVTFHKDGTLLSGHPPTHGIADILFATGSLGHGLSLAAGVALSKQLQGQTGRVVCLTSDGEWNEGSCWEALIFSRQRQLHNLTVLVDANGLQGFGRTCDVANLEPLAERFRAFGVRTSEVDGHDCQAICAALSAPEAELEVILARTKKGKGVSFMEDKMEWHYLPLTAPLYQNALEELEHKCETPSASRS